MDRPAAGQPPATDPLAELARLVGQEDPFRNVFKVPVDRPDRDPTTVSYPPPQPVSSPVPVRVEPQGPSHHDEPAHDQPDAADPYEAHAWDESAPYDHAAADDGVHGYEEQAYAEAGDGAHPGHDPVHVGYDPAQAGYDPVQAHEDGPQDYSAPALTPDLWAARAEPGYAEPQVAALADETAPVSRAPRRPLAVLAAVLVLTGGGLAATFLARSGPGAAVLGREAPTILAATGPNKVKQVDAAANSTPEDADGALLNRNTAPAAGPVKIVNSQEQPIDLAQLPKAAGSGDASGDAAPRSSSGSPFPEPRKVKTFLIRPDGTMISSNGAPVPGSAGSITVPSGPSLPQMVTAPTIDDVVAQTPAPRPATPKTAKAATTPKSAPSTIADTGGDSTADPTSTAKAKQPASSGVKAVKPKPPVEMADASASVTPAATGQGGAFGLQLAAVPSEQEARDLFGKLQKKYSSELGGYKPTIHKADSGDKSVYRLRVGNLSQDQAKSICSQLQASGGSCYVVRN